MNMKQAVLIGMMSLCLIATGCVTVPSKPGADSWPEYGQAKDLMLRAEYKMALRLAGERLETHPNDPCACWVMGKTYYLMENWDKAIEWLQRTEDLNPNWREQYTGPLLEKAWKRKQMDSKSPNKAS